ncbi:ABC transporter permease [Actinomadura rubrobrunea]|uniref:ABC transporter permease n=1 Tax=Actinomadura rubrobrunea TaxID=115335 RepID=A0A9W6PYB3_9ACTN|nr:ABC transporter permease [Actinomadura rubrobrunea]GLW65123.1 ABC transporter permease [Actinomadura rubrobrunea]
MLGLAARMIRHRKGDFVATFIALAAGVMVLTVCGMLAESALWYRGEPERYSAAFAVVARHDITVQGPEVFGERETTTVPLPERGSLPEALVRDVAAVPGVATAVADRTISTAVAAAPGEPVSGHGWASAALAPYTVVSGAPPRGDDEVAVDERLAVAGRLRPGAATTVIAGGAVQRVRVSGVVKAPGARGQERALFFTDAQAARLSPRPGRVDAIGVILDKGADRAAVTAAVERLAKRAGATVYTGDDRGLAERPEAAAAKRLVLEAGGAFGGYAALIIGFAVAATVGLSVRHRRRDFALLRAIAATPGQVRALVLGEVGLLVLLAGAAGVPSGVLAAFWIRDQSATRGFVPEDFALTGGFLAVPAAVAGVAAVALPSAWIAARRTTRIRPTEALGEAAVEPALGGRVRLVSGLALLGCAVALIGLTGVTGGQTALGAAVAMLYTFVLAVALLAPWINRAAAVALAPALRTVFGDSGHLAAANLRANARGMVAVLTALVLSVGFGGTVWFLQDNLERQTVIQSREGTLAQHALVGAAGLPAAAAEQARRIPGVLAATGVRRTTVIVPFLGEATTAVAQGVDPQGASRTMDLKVKAGRLDDLGPGTVAVSSAQADSAGWKIGGRARLRLGDGTPVDLKVVAVYERGLGFGDVTLDNRTLAGHTAAGVDDHVLVRSAPGADVRPALERLAAAYPGGAVTGTDRFTGAPATDLAVGSWLNRLLVAVLVGYAALAAANTLIMAALARARELSLLRLLGMTRRQVRRMANAEQTALLGVALAIGVAIAAVALSAVVDAVVGQPVPHVPAQGWAAVIGGAVALALVSTAVPIRLLLRTPPVEGMGIRE